MRRFRVAGVCLVGAAFVMSAGCGPGEKARAVVKGRVTFGDMPVPMATVTFMTKDNRTGSAQTDENGNYTMNDAPIGEVQVTVSAPHVGGVGMMKGKYKPPEPPPGASVPESGPGAGVDFTKIPHIPERYEAAGSSGLTYNVKKGEQTYDIPLRP